MYLNRTRNIYGVACGLILLLVWLVAMGVYWVQIGLHPSSSALIIISALHSVSAVAVLQAMAPEMEPGRRLRRAALGGFVAAMIFPILFRTQLSNRIVLPVEPNNGRVVLINPTRSPGALQRGEWVAFRLPPIIPGVFGRPVSFERVLAIGGDRLQFLPDAVLVNGVAYPRTSEFMPLQGDWLVPAGSYFIWPAAMIPAWVRANDTRLLERLALVEHDRVLGPAYQRWFGRQQKFDPLVPLTNWAAATPKT